MISNLNIYDQYSQYWWSALSILMISSQNQDHLSPLLDQISSQLAEEQFPWQSPVPPQKDAWYALILAFKPFFKLLPLSIFSKSKKKNCLSNLTKKDNPICLSARGDTWLPPYSRKLSRAHQEKLVCHSFHCSCHYIGLNVMSLSLSHFQKIGMYSNLISLPCQVWKSHVYREGRELHSGGEGQGACLDQGFRATIFCPPSYSRSPRRLTWSTPSSLWPTCSTPCSRRSRSGSSTRGAPPPQPCSSDRWQRNREDWN